MSEIERVFQEQALTDLERELLEDDETAYSYLLENWLAAAVGLLRDARIEAGLTQEDVAERLGTKQPAIARLERDHEGRFSLRRFAEFALACGMIPLEVPLKPAEKVRRYALASTGASHTEKAMEAWHTAVTSAEDQSPMFNAGYWTAFGEHFVETCMLDSPPSHRRPQSTDSEWSFDAGRFVSYDGPTWKENIGQFSGLLAENIAMGSTNAQSDRRCVRLSGQAVGRDAALGKAS